MLDKKTSFIVLGIFLVCSLGMAQELSSLFSEANALYQDGQYTEAVLQYEQILASGYESGSLYYNMGNCYYKLQEVGRSILYYERAMRLIPQDEDLQANLALANLAIVDKIESQPDFVLFRIYRAIVYLIPARILGGLVSGTYLLLMLFLILWLVSRRGGLRRFSIRMSVVAGVLFILLGACLVGQLWDKSTRIEAIIMADQVYAMSAPGGDGIEVFTLHEGTKVLLDQESGDWMEIILPDRKVGWVRREDLEEI